MPKNKEQLYSGEYWSRFLISPRYRIVRHLILLIILSSILLHGFLVDLNQIMDYNLVTYLFILLTLTFWGLICLNIYVLIPKLLFENKFKAYILSFSGIIFLTLSITLTLTYKTEQNLQVVDRIIKSDSQLIAFLIANTLAIAFYFFAFSFTVFLQRWMLHDQQIKQLEKDKLETELKELKSLIQPDFLSRMLNKANVLAKKDQENASLLLHKLSHLLRYQLYDSTRDKVLLSADISFIKDYLNLERVHSNNFDFTVIANGNTNQALVSPLLFIPIVEKAIKYITVNKLDRDPIIEIIFELKKDKLYFSCIYPLASTKQKDIELDDLSRRLELLYGKNYKLIIEQNDINNINSLQLCL